MLLKAALCQNKIKVFDKDSGKSFGFERCLRLCQTDHGLTAAEAGVMRSVDASRDAAQHWFVYVSEDILYLQTRATITAFDAYLKRALGSDLASHVPVRVLPVSTKPLGDLEFLVDKESRPARGFARCWRSRPWWPTKSRSAKRTSIGSRKGCGWGRMLRRCFPAYLLWRRGPPATA